MLIEELPLHIMDKERYLLLQNEPKQAHDEDEFEGDADLNFTEELTNSVESVTAKPQLTPLPEILDQNFHAAIIYNKVHANSSNNCQVSF